MNILHIAPYYPSDNAMHAGGVAMGHEIDSLKKMGHRIYVVTFVQEEYDYQLYIREHRDCDECVVMNKKRKIQNVLRHPLSPVFFATRMDSEFFEKVKKTIKKYNIQAIHMEYSSMLWCLKLKHIMPDLKYVAVLHDVTVQGYERKTKCEKNWFKKLILKVETNRIYKYENFYLRNCDEIVTFSEKDQKLIKEKYQLSSHRINTYFGLDDIIEKKRNIHRQFDGNYSICFIGQMGRKENEEAAIRLINIFEKISIENKKLYIVGARPSERLLSLCKENVVITGFVDDINDYVLRNCDVACFPLNSGAGIKIKVLEALALGIPVITNDIGAEGIDENYEYLIHAETNDDFIRQISNNRGIKRAVSQKFYNDFSWEVTELTLKRIYGENDKI